VSIGKALIFESTLASFGPPPVRTFDAINHAATRYDKALKQREPIMIGTSAKLYTTNEDLVVLKQAELEDRLTGFVHRYLPVFFMVV
jgi:hypothetical protein